MHVPFPSKSFPDIQRLLEDYLALHPEMADLIEEPAKRSKFITCVYCGQDNAIKSKVCEFCGGRLPHE